MKLYNNLLKKVFFFPEITYFQLGRSKLLKMLPSFSPRNLRIFENYPRKILENDLALILILEPQNCSRISWESLKFLKVIFSKITPSFSFSNFENFRGLPSPILEPRCCPHSRKLSKFENENSRGLRVSLTALNCTIASILCRRN